MVAERWALFELGWWGSRGCCWSWDGGGAVGVVEAGMVAEQWSGGEDGWWPGWWVLQWWQSSGVVARMDGGEDG